MDHIKELREFDALDEETKILLGENQFWNFVVKKLQELTNQVQVIQ